MPATGLSDTAFTLRTMLGASLPVQTPLSAYARPTECPVLRPGMLVHQGGMCFTYMAGNLAVLVSRYPISYALFP
eukprot:3941551-Rhodomonas_salina.1